MKENLLLVLEGKEFENEEASQICENLVNLANQVFGASIETRDLRIRILNK